MSHPWQDPFRVPARELLLSFCRLLGRLIYALTLAALGESSSPFPAEEHTEANPRHGALMCLLQGCLALGFYPSLRAEGAWSQKGLLKNSSQGGVSGPKLSGVSIKDTDELP